MQSPAESCPERISPDLTAGSKTVALYRHTDRQTHRMSGRCVCVGPQNERAVCVCRASERAGGCVCVCVCVSGLRTSGRCVCVGPQNERAGVCVCVSGVCVCRASERAGGVCVCVGPQNERAGVCVCVSGLRTSGRAGVCVCAGCVCVGAQNERAVCVCVSGLRTSGRCVCVCRASERAGGVCVCVCVCVCRVCVCFLHAPLRHTAEPLSAALLQLHRQVRRRTAVRRPRVRHHAPDAPLRRACQKNGGSPVATATPRVTRFRFSGTAEEFHSNPTGLCTAASRI